MGILRTSAIEMKTEAKAIGDSDLWSPMTVTIHLDYSRNGAKATGRSDLWRPVAITCTRQQLAPRTARKVK